MKNMYLLIMLTVMVLGLSCSRDGLDFNGGLLSLGSVEMTQEQFREKLSRGKNFTLPNDIKLEDWVSVSSYRGRLDGNNKTLTITSFRTGAVGLIREIENGAKVKDLKIKLEGDLVNTNTSQTSHIGVLAGDNKGTIENVHVSMESGKKVEGNTAGGLVGYNSNRIEESSARGYVSGHIAGVLVGYNSSQSIVEESSARGYVSGTIAGGLVGYNSNQSIVEESSAIVAVTGSGEDSFTGGLVGENHGTITKSYARGAVVGTGESSFTGGLAGYNGYRITNSYASGVVIGTGANSSAGGLVGSNASQGTVTNSYARGAVIGTGASSIVGSLVGINNKTIEKSFVLSRTGLKPVGSGSDTGVKEIAKSAIEETTFSAAGWETTIWDFVAGKWPTLKWQPSRQRPGGQGGQGGNPQALTCPDRSYTAVSTEEELQKGLEGGGSICLTANIRLTVWESIEEFKGKLDGNNKTLTLASFTTGAVGLIKTIESGAQVKDLSIELEVDLVNSSTSANIYIGVLAGENQGTIDNVHVRMAIGKKVGGSNAGGLVGSNDYGGTIKESRVIGTVEATGDRGEAGGLVGFNDKGKIENSHAEGKVTVSGEDSSAGGLVGYNDGTITNSYAKGAVSATGEDSNAGGLVGYNDDKSTIKDSRATANVTGTGRLSRAGGLVGYNDGTITNSYAKGAVRGEYYAGGLVGYNDDKSTIKDSRATANVTGTGRFSIAGGLVGMNYDGGTITNSYATGNVSGTSNAGGLVGRNYDGGTITNSYATGNVTGTGRFSIAGGLVGRNYSSKIENSYATGNVTGTGRFSIAGGLVGSNSGTITNSFCLDRTGLNAVGSGSASGVRKIEQTDITATTFTNAGWSRSVWKNLVGGQWPKLKWEP